MNLSPMTLQETERAIYLARLLREFGLEFWDNDGAEAGIVPNSGDVYIACEQYPVSFRMKPGALLNRQAVRCVWEYGRQDEEKYLSEFKTPQDILDWAEELGAKFL